MALFISGTVSTPPAYMPPPVTPAPKAMGPSADSVKLSQSAQIVQMSQLGQNPSEIAASLGIPVATVNSDLGISTATVNSNPTATSAVPVSYGDAKRHY